MAQRKLDRRAERARQHPDFFALERAFARTITARRLRTRILRLQQRLRPELDPAAWMLLLTLEETMNERFIGFVGYLQRRLGQQSSPRGPEAPRTMKRLPRDPQFKV
jgi:hypothetical protein